MRSTSQSIIRFADFALDLAGRRLSCDGAPVELNARYFDALVLLLRDPGSLVSKERFHDEVWRGIPVTDDALTQCIRTLRRALGDSATSPRFIETVPKHGYRFIAPVEQADTREAPDALTDVPPRIDARRFLLLGGAGTIGGGFAGLAGGLFYGLVGAAQPLEPGIGATSVLLVLVCLTILVGVIGGAGVGFGIAATDFAPNRRWYWRVLGGALGGLVVGAFARLLGLDAFNLLLGQSPGDITGAAEGALLGGAIGLAASLPSLRRSVAAAALAGGLAGAAIIALGGHLMAGSLDQLARQFPATRLRLDQLGALLGEREFGPLTQHVSGALEGLLFGVCLIGAMGLARHSLDEIG